MAVKVEMIEVGIEMALNMVVRMFCRKSIITSAAINPPIMSWNWISSMDS
jgi:hypothetical protein